MDSKSLRSTEIRAVSDTINFTRAFSRADSEKDCCFLFSNFRSVFKSKSRLPSFFSNFFRPDVFTSRAVLGVVSLAHMFLRSKPFQVIGMVVGFVAVFVMNVMGLQRFFEPAKSNHSMDKSATSAITVSIFAEIRREWFKPLKDFSAFGNCVRRAEESVLDSIYRDAQHRTSQGFNYG